MNDQKEYALVSGDNILIERVRMTQEEVDRRNAKFADAEMICRWEEREQ